MEDSYISEEYLELINQLQDEINEGFITEEEELFVIRQSFKATLNGRELLPVVDFFFSEPALEEKMAASKVVDVKKGLFEMISQLPENASEELREALNMHVSCLKDYTSGNNKRNEKTCHLVVAKESGLPMAIYFEEDGISEQLTRMSAKDLLNELKEAIA